MLLYVSSSAVELLLWRCFLGISEIFSRFKSILNNAIQWQASTCQIAFREKNLEAREITLNSESVGLIYSAIRKFHYDISYIRRASIVFSYIFWLIGNISKEEDIV